jgi:hypothetical protein
MGCDSYRVRRSKRLDGCLMICFAVPLEPRTRASELFLTTHSVDGG